MNEQCNNGKHFWDFENGYCVACAMTIAEWTNWNDARIDKVLQKTCDCGASKTTNDNLHSRWCSAYRESK